MHGVAGDPLVYPASVSLVDDGDLNPATAAALDVSGQNLADRTAFLNAQRGAVAAENWQLPFAFPANVKSECKPSFDAVHGCWLFGDNVANTLSIRTYLGLPGAKTQAGIPGSGGALGTPVSLAARITCVLKDPTDADTFYLAAIATSGGVGHVYRFKLSTGVYTGILVTSGACTDLQVACFAGQLIVAPAQGASSALSTSGNQGTTFTGVAGTIPDCDTTWTLAVSPTELLAVANHTIATNAPGLLSSADGITFSPQSFGAFAGGDAGIGTAWGRDRAGPCWIFCFKTGGTDREFLRSPDGITWTNIGVTLTTAPLWDLVAIDTTFVGVSIDTANLVGTRVLYSVDGALTWYQTQFAAINFTVARLWLGASSSQLCVSFDDLAGTETEVAFSSLQGTSKVVAL